MCQVGTAFAARTEHASLRQVGLFSNRLLLWGIAFELVFTALLVYAPPLQHVFGTTALPPDALGLIAIFPFVVWGSDELRRWVTMRRLPADPHAKSGRAGRKSPNTGKSASTASTRHRPK